MVRVYYEGTHVCNLNSLADAETYILWETEVCGLDEDDFTIRY